MSMCFFNLRIKSVAIFRTARHPDTPNQVTNRRSEVTGDGGGRGGGEGTISPKATPSPITPTNMSLEAPVRFGRDSAMGIRMGGSFAGRGAAGAARRGLTAVGLSLAANSRLTWVPSSVRATLK